ncbi:hypothetical protein F5887DRAFT_1078783 [Amanita rubescens]|nr:hypothetical protein F5887DRAFT_1078783 [Amanita rubescens]
MEFAILCSAPPHVKNGNAKPFSTVSFSLSVLEAKWDSGGMGIPTSASTQALFVPTPMMGPSSPRFAGPGEMLLLRLEDGANLVVQGVPGSGGSFGSSVTRYFPQFDVS